MTNNETKDPLAVELGKRGGKETSKKYGADHYRRMQALGVKTKLAKKKSKS